MTNKMSAIAEESRREFKRCAKDFVTCMNKVFAERYNPQFVQFRRRN